MQAQGQSPRPEQLTIPAFDEFGGLEQVCAVRSGPDCLSVQIEGAQPAIRQVAARMMAGQLYATFGETPIKLLRYTVTNQGVPGRLVFDATYRVRAAAAHG
ncbi:hypothetical protein [Pseudorhodoferax sp.]|uniref:hypothetical protein n=1 Tax=Pseudorhodoferax sp. TaxID=1993553 RepID=UPI002DD655F6|nr:hypothetical protein [Pseudorhodoferax sp.]